MSEAHAQTQHPFQDAAIEGAEPASRDHVSTSSVGQAKTDRGWGSHPINIRISIPYFFGRWYFTVIAGPERRDQERRAVERRKHPLLRLGNVIFLFLLGAVIGLGAAVLMIQETIEALSG